MMYQKFKSSRPGKWLKDNFFSTPPGLRILNFIIQRVFRINAACPYQTHYTSQVRQPQNLHLSPLAARSLAIMSHCNIQAHNGVHIGSNTFFASGLSIISANHDPSDLVHGDSVVAPPVKIGANCWIGCNVTILPGVSIGDDVIIGASSVVTKTFPAKVVIAGNPAKIVKPR